MLLTIFFGVFWLWSTGIVSAQSQSLQIRAVLPNPVGADTHEWVAVENVSQQNFVASGQSMELRDVKGSVTEFLWPWDVLASEVRLVTATQSGIVLNNDQDQVELVQNGTVVDSTALYTAPVEGKVWLRGSNNEWKWVAEAEFFQRLQTRNWAWETPVPSISPTPSPSAEPLYYVMADVVRISPCTTPEWIEIRGSEDGFVATMRVEDTTGTIISRTDQPVTTTQSAQISWSSSRLSNSGETFTVWIGDVPQVIGYASCSGSDPFIQVENEWVQSSAPPVLSVGGTSRSTAPVATQSAGVENVATILVAEHWFKPVTMNAQTSLLERPPYPEYDFEGEKLSFLRWKQRAIAGSLGIIGGGVCWLVYGFPWMWRWYKDRYG